MSSTLAILTTYYLLLTTYCSLLTTHRFVPTTYLVGSTTYYLPLRAHHVGRPRIGAEHVTVQRGPAVLGAAVAELVVVRSHPRVEPVVAEDLHMGLQAWSHGLQAWSHGVAGLVAWGCRLGRMGLQVAPLAGSRARHSLPVGHGPGASHAGTAQARPQLQWQSAPRLQPAQWRLRLQLHLQRLKRHLSRSPPQRLPHAAARPACVPRHAGAHAQHAHVMHAACTQRAHGMHTSCTCRVHQAA